MASITESIRAECLRYKALAEAAITQLSEAELSAAGATGDNSIAVICWHLSGNLRSRFTDFLASDGEKPWRQREEEFQRRTVTRRELLERWDQGWNVLLATLDTLTDEQLELTITIRRQPMLVHEALHRSLAHIAYHTGQIVYIGKSLRGKDWQYLSIPPGKSDAYNQNPVSERAAAHAARLIETSKGEQPIK
jgi:uncharacterized damage-inducible protein DinB